MPAVVLRHPDLPGQPVVVDVPVGAYIPSLYRDSGWAVDANTDPQDAEAEVEATRAEATEKAAEAAESFVPEFEPADDSAPTPKAPAVPAEPANPEPAPASLNLEKE